MKYVLDSCVAFKWLVPEIDTDKALRLRDDFRATIHELVAPDFFPVEITHSLTRAERQGRITPAQGAVLLKDLFKALPQLRPSLGLLPRAYDILPRPAGDKLIRILQPLFPFIIALP